MDPESSPNAAEDLVARWVRAAWGLEVAAEVSVREVPHCPDPTCPLRRTELRFRDRDGLLRRRDLVRPLSLVREHHVRAMLQEGDS